MSIFGNDLKDWAQSNGLKYEKKIKTGFLQLGNSSISNLISGEYNGKRIYLFKVENGSSHDFTKRYYYFNGGFYKKIKVGDIDQLLLNDNYLEKIFGVFGLESQNEIIQTLIAQIYLDTGRELDFKEVKKIFKLFSKFYNSKVSLKARIVGKIFGVQAAGVKYNSSEAIGYVMGSGEVNTSIVSIVGNTYEKLLELFQYKESGKGAFLEDINLGKFK
ncbi:MAG: hypothetical protein V3574_05025 [Candidatus Moraniibacteriota bacterium]